MKPLEVVADNKLRSDQIFTGRIHFQAFTRWLVKGFPLSKSTRVRINSRGARASLLDMG